MLFTSVIVDESVYHKLDTNFIKSQLQELEGDVAIIFACTKTNIRRNDKWKHLGTQYYRIVLPYEKVAAMPVEQVREWMLQLAKERLGLTEKAPAPALA